jgi:hypothetical protein
MNSTKFPILLKILPIFLYQKIGKKKTWQCICLSQFWSQYPKSNCKYVVSSSLTQESKREGEGVGGSGVVLNESYKISLLQYE